MVPADVAKEYRRRGWWGDDTLATLVRRHAETVPDRPAILTDRGRLSWAGYDAASSRLASALAAAGLQPGDRVAVQLPDGAGVHVAFLALEKAGLTVVGIGARAGEREREHLLGATGAVALVSPAEHAGRDMAEVVAEHRRRGAPLRHHVVLPELDRDADAAFLLDGEPVTGDAADGARLAETRGMGPDDLFLVNSTSGTTGLPKLVMHTQNRWMYFHQRAVQHGALTGEDAFFGAVPAPFGFGLWTSHVTPAVLGAPVVVVPRFSAEQALQIVEQHRVSVLACVSTQFILMLNSPDLARRDLSSLRVMFTGGEAVPFERALDFERTTGARVLQFFGSNETGLLTGTTLDDSPDQRLRTAGRVVPEMNVRLFDRGRDVTAAGTGQPGCKGPATSLGYLGDPAANRELFTEDGWMLMGDVCSIDGDGYLRVTGRISDIVIRGGKNISAVRVEEEVATHPAVALAAAVAMPDPVFGERVCACVELRPGSALTLAELVQHLADRGTSKELFPEHLLVLGELPRGSGGKVAKGALRELVRAGSAHQSGVAPDRVTARADAKI